MSNYYSGVTFSQQVVTPADYATVRRAVIPDGILEGCAFDYAGDVLSMSAGALLACGRHVRHISSHNWNLVGAASGYARIVLDVDLSRASTVDEFDQVNDFIEYAADLSEFQPLEQSNINTSGVKYQIELCVVALGSGGITGLLRSAKLLQPQNLYAPAGFGVGQDTPEIIATMAELDQKIQTGVFRLRLSLEESYIAACGDARFAVVAVKAFDVNNTLQEIYPVGTTSVFRRWRESGIWGQWRVQNPLMVAGTEYRTVDSYEGRPVWVKRISYTASSFSSGTVSLPHGVVGMEKNLSADVSWKRTDASDDGWRNLPASDPDSDSYSGYIGYVGDSMIKFYLGSSLRTRISKSTEPVDVILRYTKK